MIASPNLANDSPALPRYLQHLSTCETRLIFHQGWQRRLVIARTLLFAGAGFFLFTGYRDSDRPVFWLAIGWGLAIAFVAAAVVHERIHQAMQGDLVQRNLYRRLVARLHRNWTELPNVAATKPESSVLATSDDLDLLGDRSLTNWCSLAGTETGWTAIANQLTSYADAKTISGRQTAAKELSPQIDIRHHLMLQLWHLGASPASLEGFSRWANDSTKSPRWLASITWLGPICLVVGVLIAVAKYDTVPGPIFWSGVVLSGMGLLTNVMLVLGYIGIIHNTFKQIGTHNEIESTCHALLQSLTQMQPRSTLLAELKRSLCDSSERDSALVALPHLRWPMRFAGLRLNPGLYLPFLVLQILFLWDFRVYGWIERWRANYATAVPRWLASIGQLEAILSAAAIHNEYPLWAFPSFELSDGQIFQADQLGHPLINDTMRVANDLNIQCSQPLLLVTGSNMSGKSTLMRAVGVNVALSRLGAPVCAKSFHCHPMELATSIRVRDSLADGVSFFMAELNRLREVVDAVQKSRQSHGRMSLVILDEILQGTNSSERLIAVSHVIQTLLGFDSLLLVSTHDLQLAEADEFHSNSQVVHFREHFEETEGRSQMKFDYQMHTGIAPTTNALKLLELVGLGKPLQG